jgi:outer membrane receptor protein involved in Fe transport
MKSNYQIIIALSLVLPCQLVVAESLSNEANKAYQQLQQPKNYSISAGSLTKTLNRFAQQAGVVLVFDPVQTEGKNSNGLNGKFTTSAGFSELLKASGLEVTVDGKGIYTLKKASPPPVNSQKVPALGETNENIQLDKIDVRAKRFHEIGPLPGLGLTKEQIPGNVQSITAQEIKESHSLSLSDLLNKKLQSVNVNDYQGNPFQMDISYRGFTAGPQIGTPQGLSVFFDGIRVNEPFGDIVNWDMIPMNALAGVDVFPGSNPIFGLNTLGGAFTMKTKDGFNNAGVDAQVLTGSFGRKYLQAEGGWNNGTVALFGAGNFFLEDGWRENSPSKVNQFFGKASYRGDKLDLNLSTLLVKTDLVGNGLVPSQMYEQDRNGVFTGEDTTKNKLEQFQLSGSYFVDDSFTITGQVYRRNSNRRGLGADAYMDGFPGTQELKRNLAPGEEISCQFLSTNQYLIPDYYVFELSDPYDQTSNPFIQDYIANIGNPTYDMDAALALYAPNAKNGVLDASYAKAARESFNYWKNPQDQALYQYNNIPAPEATGPITSYPNGDDYSYLVVDVVYDFYRDRTGFDPTLGYDAFVNYFYGANGNKNVVIPIAPKNRDVCQGSAGDLTLRDANGVPTGAADGAGSGNGPGQVEGIPTAVLTDNNIKQQTDGASVQFNWNLDNHKLMIGASIDAAFAAYTNSQRFGLLDENRKAYLAPDQILDMYAAADFPISNNNFSGTSTTKSIYASDTWSPVDTLHITAAGRYNETQIKNKIATRTAFEYFSLGSYVSTPDWYNLCIGSASNCPSTGYRVGDGSQLLKPAETEKFSFYSLNPSLGLTWQAKEDLNFYVNLAQGTRTPSVVELGCAYDGRPSGSKLWAGDKNGNGDPDPEEYVDVPNSLAQNRSCTLPTALSGDPYLPQIKATTYDIGLRGAIGENFRWNLGAYQTDLKDDIYLVTVGAASSFFDTIGKTRRRGIEAGISGIWNKLSLGLNYSMTDATFQSEFDMISTSNSSAVATDLSNALASVNGEAFQSIRVKPGNRMPGIPLHNLNANISYEITDKWRAGFSAVVHSDSIVRGNENNKHRPGLTQVRINRGNYVARQTSSNPGRVDGYAVFNFQTSYKLSTEWTASLLVNNIFDKEYFTAGRLGRNPFSPSINGAIGPSGYNHNSDDWLSTNFLAPGAPRGVWFSLNWQFDPNAKPSF